VSSPLAKAELIADRGEVAVSDEFFRSPSFLDAEGVTHTLRIATDGGELLAPLIVDEIPPSTGRNVDSESTFRSVGPAFDAISPYGYPGVAAPGGISIDPATVDFSSAGLVTVFIRHTLGEPPLGGTRERNVVQIADPELPPKSRPSDRNQINRNLRRGYELQLLSGPETTAAQRAAFLAAYEQTMRRTGASERYFFAAAYFDRILESSQTWLALARAPDGEIAAASIVVRSDGYLHYYLSGSADSHLRDSPMKNIVAALVELSAEQGLPLNLGGGISPGDRLEEFKRGFANRQLPWRTSEIVCDAEAYARLAAGREAGGFFPAYRAS
jgi:Acetyltransferase (GNAT) domain